MTDLAPLHSEDAERSVLGGLLFRPGLVSAMPLRMDDFFSMRHQLIWRAMANLATAGATIDTVTVADEVRRQGAGGMFAAVGDDQEAGALAYLSDIALACPSPENTESYAKILVRYSEKRAAVNVLADVLHRLKTSEVAESGSVVLEAIAKLQALGGRGGDPSEALGDLMLSEIAAIEHDLAAADRGEWVGGMPTGIRKLDENTGGLPLGSMTLVLGETGSGKSTVAMSFARAAWREAGDIPLVFSYEDGKVSFARRALAQESGVPTWRIGARKFHPGQDAQVVRGGFAAAAHRRERIVKLSGEPVDELCQLVRRARSKPPAPGAKSFARLVVVDYLQRIPKPRERWVNSTPEAIQEISNRLEDLAAKEEIAVVLFAQVTDAVKERGGRIIDVRDCADGRAGGKGCKLALGIYRPAMYDKNEDPTRGELIVLKNNQGPAGQDIAVPIQLDLATHTIGDP